MIRFPGWKCPERRLSSEAREGGGSRSHSVFPDHPRGKRHDSPRVLALASPWAEPTGRAADRSQFPSRPQVSAWRFPWGRGTRGVKCESPPGEKQRASSWGGTDLRAAGRVRRERKGGILQEVDSQASACGHSQIFSTSVSYSLPLSLEDRPGPELLGWGRGAVSRKSQISERRPSTSKLSHPTGPILGRIYPQDCGPRRAPKTRSGGRVASGAS